MNDMKNAKGQEEINNEINQEHQIARPFPIDQKDNVSFVQTQPRPMVVPNLGQLPPPPFPPQQFPPYPMERSNPYDSKRNFAITSMVLGIVSIVVCFSGFTFILSILAIIFGILGLQSSTKGMAITGIATGAGSLVLTLVLGVIFLCFAINAPSMNF